MYRKLGKAMAMALREAINIKGNMFTEETEEIREVVG
jgi:hypothetical protein